MLLINFSREFILFSQKHTAQVNQECPNSLQKPDSFSDLTGRPPTFCVRGHFCAYFSDVGLDLWIKEQYDRLRTNIDAFTKIFSFVSKCLKLGLIVNDPLQIRRIPLKRLSIHFYYCSSEQAPFNQIHFDAEQILSFIILF